VVFLTAGDLETSTKRCPRPTRGRGAMAEKKNKGGLTLLIHWMNYKLCCREVVLQLCAGKSSIAVLCMVLFV